MKTAVYKPMRRPMIAYPNAATRREIFHKVLDGVLVAACGMGTAAILLLLVVLQ